MLSSEEGKEANQRILKGTD